jgi:hypothetical protein
MKNVILLRVLTVFLLVITAVIYINKKPSKNVDESVVAVNMIIKDHKFFPDTIEVPKFTKVKLTVHNQDPTAEEFESHDLHRERIIMPHDSITLIFAPLAPGKYDFFGDFHQDTAQGSIIVKN